MSPCPILTCDKLSIALSVTRPGRPLLLILLMFHLLFLLLLFKHLSSLIIDQLTSLDIWKPWEKNHFAQYSSLAHESIAHCLCSYRLWWKLRIYHGLEIRMCLCSLCKALACPLLWPYQMVFLPWPKMSCNFSFIQRWLAVRHMYVPYTLYRIPCSVPRISRLFLHWFPLGQLQPFTI